MTKTTKDKFIYREYVYNGKTGYLIVHRRSGGKCILEGSASLFFKLLMGEQSQVDAGLTKIATAFKADGNRVRSDYDSFLRNFDNFLATGGKSDLAALLPLLAARGLIHQCMLELTHRCNLKCAHCYIGNRGSDKAHAASILDRIETVRGFLLKTGCVNLTVTGGEIGLVPDVFKILRDLSEDFVLTVMTNATVWTKSDYLKLKDIPINTVQVTLFSMNPAIHDMISGVAGSWEKVWSSITIIRQLGIPFRINTPVLKQNAASIPGLVMGLAKKGLKANIDVKCFPHGQTSDCVPPIPAVYELINLGLAPKLQKSACTAIKHKIRIGPDGGIFPCEYLQERLGNVFDEDIAESIVASSRDNTLQKTINEGISSSVCDGCVARGKCFNCAAFNHAEHKNYSTPNSYICALNKLQYAPSHQETIC